MKPVVGKPYEIAPDWYVALKSPRRAIIIRRSVQVDPEYVEGQEEEGWGAREWVEYTTPTKNWQNDGFTYTHSLEQAIKNAEWAPLPNVWAHPFGTGYTSLEQAVETLVEAVPHDAPIDYRLLIELIGHAGAFRVHDPLKRGRNEAYWAAAANAKPDMSEVTVHLTDNAYWREWALRLGTLHGRRLSSMELVSLCTSEQQTMRDFALTASGQVEESPYRETPASKVTHRAHKV